MKLVILSLLFLSSHAFADLTTDETISPITAEAKSFKEDCLIKNNIDTVRAIVVANKTAESLDKALLIDSLNKDMGLTVDPKGHNSLIVLVKATSSAKTKIRSTTYTLDFTLNGTNKELCKNSYSKVMTEDRSIKATE